MEKTDINIVEELTNTEKDLLMKYKDNTERWTDSLNIALSKGDYNMFNNDITIIDNIFNKFCINKNIILYRGTSTERAEEILKNGLIKQYFSTTIKETLTIRHCESKYPAILHINISQNTNLIPILYIKGPNEEDLDNEEKEILLPRNTYFVLKNKETKKLEEMEPKFGKFPNHYGFIEFNIYEIEIKN